VYVQTDRALTHGSLYLARLISKDLSEPGKVCIVKNKKMNEGFSRAIEVLFCANI
jgi:hypothetical protein